MKVKIETARDGHKVPVVETEEKTIHLGSMYDGRYAASVWCDKNLSERSGSLILVGIGDCQIALEAAKRLKDHLLVFEPDKSIFDKMKTTSLYKKLQGMPNTEISNDKNKIETWMNRIFNEDTFEDLDFYVHPGYQLKELEETIDEIREMSKEKIKELISFRASMVVISDSMITNILKNYPKMKDSMLLSRLQRVWDPRIPCIIVGAGPSLNKNIDLLKEVGNKACIICLDTAYKALKERGIRPHIVCTVDAKKPLEVFGDPDEWDSWDIPMAAIASSRPEIVDMAKGNIIWCAESNTYARTIRGEMGGDEGLFPLDYGVSSMGIATAVSLGANQIVFIGMDLAYSEDKKSHACTVEDDFSKFENETVEGYYGGVVYSRGDWLQMKRWIEIIAENDNWGRYIDATEGGAKIQHMPQMTLERVISYLKEPEEDWTKAFSDPRVRISDEEYDQMMERYNRSLDEYDLINKTSYEDAFYGGACKDYPLFSLMRGYMKSRAENTREERYAKAKEIMGEIIESLREEKTNE